MRSTEKPSNPEAHVTFSTYNNTKILDALHGQYYSNWQCLFYFRSVEKALVGITPLVALFCFILALYGGCISDKEKKAVNLAYCQIAARR